MKNINNIRNYFNESNKLHLIYCTPMTNAFYLVYMSFCYIYHLCVIGSKNGINMVSSFFFNFTFFFKHEYSQSRINAIEKQLPVMGIAGLSVLMCVAFFPLAHPINVSSNLTLGFFKELVINFLG